MELIDKIKLITKEERKNKTVSTKITQSDYDLIITFCKEHNCKLSDLLNLKLEELIIEINKHNFQKLD